MPHEKKWSEEELEQCYAYIRKQSVVQHEDYTKFIEEAGKEQVARWKQLAEDFHLDLNVDSGRIRYKDNFKPLDLQVEICYIRHGKTDGNTEPRVYQVGFP